MRSDCKNYVQMIDMTEMWYDSIIASILASKTDVLLIVDPANLIGFSKVKESLIKRFSTIMEYENELKLRRVLREKELKILVIFHDKKDIPFDLLSSYATIEVDLDDIFPLLSKEVLLRVPFDNYQEIYMAYIELKKDRYDRLSELETSTFIEGIISSETIKEKKRSSELIDALNELLGVPLTDCNTWGTISQIFGELMFLVHRNNLDIGIEKLKLKINDKFKDYVLKYYEDMIYSTNSFINSNILDIVFNNPDEKNALICFDCMGFEEWNVIREYLERKVRLEFDVKYSFSMLPSETNYSSSALFAGLTPKRIRDLDFINEIHWRNERGLFKHCLNERRGIDKNLIYFQRCVDAREIKINYNSLGDYSAIGLVFSFVDRITHNTLMDKNRLIDNIRMCLEESNIDEFIKSLLNHGFHVYFVSDHGSIFCRGNGINVSRDLVDSKAKRYLIDHRRELLEEYKTEDSIIIQLRNMIGDNYLLLLTGNSMFARRNEEGLTHGGISLEEMVIPFIEVKL